MADLIVTEFLSLDGVMEAPGGEEGFAHSGWVMDSLSPEQEAWKLRETLEAETLLLGRVTYEGFAEAWPGRGGEFADKMNSMPKHVASRTLTDLRWENSALLEGHVPEAVAELKRSQAGPILVAGSRLLCQTLFEYELVDELRAMVFPVLLGGGRRLFPEDGVKVPLELAASERFPSGVVVNTYRPA